jgi:4'-phosphopantetheinyl transferase
MHTTWHTPPATVSLGDDEIHVWRAQLNCMAARVQYFQRCLAPDEVARAARLYFADDRERFVIARGVLRAILARYAAVEPQRLMFCYTPFGKPMLIGEPYQTTLSFNVSHSGGLALYAVARDRPVGVDVERMRAELPFDQIAARFYSPRENLTLQALPPETRREAFFRGWTRKEAYIKAQGEGLQLLQQVEVSLAPGDPARLLNAGSKQQDPQQWKLWDLAPGPGFVAALATTGPISDLHCWQWSDVLD